VHNDCIFLSFTNGTLVDEAFAKALSEVGNFGLAFSIEGFESATDFRRGKGTYKKVLEGMQNMKKYGGAFGFSACYHSKNTEAVGDPEFLDFLIEQGCMFGWYFTYMPLGKDADTSLLATAEQREHMFHFVREARKTKPIFLIDFGMMGNMSMAVLQAEKATFISMQQGMLNHVHSFTIPTSISKIPRCSMPFSRPCSWNIKNTNHSTRTICGHAHCSITLVCLPIW